MDLVSLRQLIRLIASSTSNKSSERHISEASTAGGSLAGETFEPTGFLDSSDGPDDSDDSGDSSGAKSPYQPALSPRFGGSSSKSGSLQGKSLFNPDRLGGSCEGINCDDDPSNERKTESKKRRLRGEVSGVSALGGGPAMPLGASAQYPAQSIGVTSYVRPKRSRKRKRKARKT